MSTECEYCKFKEGDCGYHHKSNGITNYDIASLSACDQYGNCMFFKRKECNCNGKCIHYNVCGIRKEANNKEWFCFAYREERKKGEWTYGEDEYGQDGYFCSECGFFVPWYYAYYENDIHFIREYNVCPHCLAEMISYTGKDRDMRGG